MKPPVSHRPVTRIRAACRRLLACTWLLAALATANPCAAATSEEEIDALIREGQQALAAGQPGRAVFLLERVVLEQPWRLGVWMDYALALQMAGQPESARIIYRNLLGQNPPDYLRAWLQRQVSADLGNGGESTWQTGGKLSVQAGHDSNVNRATGGNSLSLTYPFGLVELKLADSARARGGAALWFGWEGRADRPAGTGGNWSIQGALNARLTPSLSGQAIAQPTVGITRQWRHDTAETLLDASVQQLHYGGSNLQNQLRTGLYRGRPQATSDGACMLLYGAEWKVLNYPASPELNGDYLGMAVNFGCENGDRWNLLAHAGVDQPRNNRPGHRQYQLDVNLQRRQRVAGGHLLGSIGLAYMRDTRGYSPLLENDSVRGIRRGSLGLEYAHPVAAATELALRLEIYGQRSNLALFDNSGRALWLGLSRSF